MVIQINVSALISYRESAKTNRALKKNLEKLSSGYRINRSADDASGLAVSERMRIYCTEYGRCHSNAKEGLNLAKTADGALAEINDMLRRARELCIQAENGTYSQQELASISDEMNELFSEIDRITEGSFFNEIQLFRGAVGPDFHYEYDETFTALPTGSQETWGEMGFIQSGDFDPPVEVKKATATFQLDDSIDVNNPETLNGKAIRIGNSTYYFAKSGVATPSGVTARFNIYSTVEATLNQLVNYNDIESVALDKATRTVTLTTMAKSVHYVFDTDKGPWDEWSIADGDYPNGRPVTNPEVLPTIKEVDGSSTRNNRAIYGDATGTYILNQFSGDVLTADQIEGLQHNTLRVGSHTINLKDLNISAGASRADVGKAIADKINNDFANYSAVYDDTTKGLTVTVTGLSTSSSTDLDIYEIRGVKQQGTETIPGKPYQPPREEPKTYWTSEGIRFSTSGTTGGNESHGTTTVTLPSLRTDKMTSCKIGNKTYLFYDSGRDTFKDPDSSYDKTAYPSGVERIDIKGWSDTQFKDFIADKLMTNSGVSSDTTVSRSGDTVVFTSKKLKSPPPSVRISSPAVSVYSYKMLPEVPGTPDIPGTPTEYYPRALSSYNPDLRQPIETPFHLGADLDKDNLGGSGFRIGSYAFEFVNGGSGLYTSYTDIDISGCSNFDDLLAAVKAKLPSGWDARLETSSPNDVQLRIKSSSYYPLTVTDGLLGIEELSKGPVQFTGGVDAEQSQKEIDFSSVNSDNLNDLLGKGFRVNCASCPDEYINFFFCWDNSGRAPESFKITGSDGVERTIHNISVELSKVTSGDRIVEDIVNQVSRKLNHFTGLKVGTPPTTLVAYERRPGRVENDAGDLLLGSVESGVKANFTYSVNIRKVEEYPEDGSVAMKENIVDIYVGSEPDPQIIPVHLPYIDLKTLRLRPPETVDLNASDQDASAWLNRVDQANLAISKARGVIGADHNRLETAVQALSHAKENITDAESRIRDTDMAEEMMERVKLQILTQTQQSMLSQALSQPQQVLRLIS